MKEKRKGFTLIELLATIVILAVIALITTPIVLNLINTARKGAARESVRNYVKAINLKIVSSLVDGQTYEDRNDYIYDEIKVEVDGTIPTSGVYEIKNGKVTSGTFCIYNKVATYNNGKIIIGEKCKDEDLKLLGSVELSKNAGVLSYPATDTFEIIKNISGGELTCTSSDEEVATCKVTDNVVTVETKPKEGVATITVISKETSKYKEAKAVYVVTTSKGLLSYTANDYTGVYDGESHGITITSSGATISYSSDGTNYSSENPKYSNVGVYTTYFKIEKEGYNTITGSKTITINKANGTLNLSSTSGTIYSGKITTVTAISTGSISCLSSNTNVATCTVSDKIITINGISAGDATITIISEETANYNSISKTYSVTIEQSMFSTNVKLGDYIKMIPTSTSFTTNTGKTGYTSSQTINPSELNIWRVIRINNDGTIEMVSENVSSVTVYFRGQAGYKNLVGYLNEIAKAYTNTKYVQSTRHMGYNGQTEYLNTLNSTSPSWTCSTGENCNPNESKGGGDTLYETDTNLVKVALGTLKSNKAGTTAASNYWLSSRMFFYSNSSYWGYIGRSIDSSGNLFSNFLLYYFDGSYSCNLNYAIRPILTLKSGIQAVGTGTSSDPYVLE